MPILSSLQKLFLLILLVTCNLNASICTSPSADLCKLNAGSAASIDKFSVCKAITNGSANAIMIPSKTSGEWASFVANPPPSVSLANCAAPVYVTQVDAASGAVGKPTGLAVGDLMIVTAYADYDFTSTILLSGFTYINAPYATTGAWYSARFYKIATAGDVSGSGYNFSSSYLNATMLTVIRGADPANPIQAHTRNTSTGTTLTFTASTTTQSNSMVFLTGEASSVVPSTPAGYTSLWSKIAYATRFCSIIQAAPGTTGSPTSTISMSEWWSASLVVINPI